MQREISSSAKTISSMRQWKLKRFFIHYEIMARQATANTEQFRLPSIKESQVKCSPGLLWAQVQQRSRNVNYYLQFENWRSCMSRVISCRDEVTMLRGQERLHRWMSIVTDRKELAWTAWGNSAFQGETEAGIVTWDSVTYEEHLKGHMARSSGQRPPMTFNTRSDMTHRTIPKSQDLLNKMRCEESKNTNKITKEAESIMYKTMV